MDVARHDVPMPPRRGERSTRAHAARALADLALALGAAAGPLVRRGSSDRLGHRTHLVTHVRDPYVAKYGAAPEDRRSMWMEARMLPAVRRYLRPGVMVPRLLRVAETPERLELDLEWLAGYHSHVSLRRCIEGLDWLGDLPLGPFADLPALDVPLLLTHTEFDLRALAAYPTWQRHFPPPAQVLDRMGQHAFALAAFPDAVVHNDYRPGNVLARDDTIALIDWAQAARGSLLLDWMHLGVTRVEWLPAIWRELRWRVADDPEQSAALPHAAWFCAMVAACHTAAHTARRPRGFSWFPRALLRTLLRLEPPMESPLPRTA